MLQLSLKPKTMMQRFKNPEKVSTLLRLTTLIILVFVAVGAIGIRLFSAHAAGCTHPYTVQWGDTLSAIAYRNGTTWQALAQQNGIENANLIFVGQQICLAKAATSECVWLVCLAGAAGGDVRINLESERDQSYLRGQ